MTRYMMAVLVAVAAGLGLARWLTSSSGSDAQADDARGSSVRVDRNAGASGSRAEGAVPATRETAAAIDRAAAAPGGVLERDPRKPGYDAARIHATRLRDMRGLFEAEPRDPSWAARREQDIVAAAQDALRFADPDMQMEVECRTGTCRVRVSSKLKFLVEEMGPYPLSCLATYSEPEFGDASEPAPYAYFYLAFGQANRDGTAFDEHRTATCDRYRDGWLAEARELRGNP